MAEEKPTYLGPNTYVKKVGETEEGEPEYIAGPRSKKYEEGEPVPTSYAKSVLGSINYRNRVMALLRKPRDDPETFNDLPEDIQENYPDDYQEAQQTVSEFNNLTDELQKAQEAGDQERVEEIERKLAEKREQLGSP